MSFFEVEFPRKLTFNSATGSGNSLMGGPSFSTQVNLGFSGFEQRNRNWAAARSKWQVTVVAQQNLTAPSVTDFDLLRNFHMVVGGMADGFRLFEPTDFSATRANGSGILGVGDGTTEIFQLTKTYNVGGRSYVRTINKPITNNVKDYQNNPLANTVVVYVNGVVKTLGVDYTLDYTTGLITFTVAPPVGQQVAADFQFHYPVRFDSDDFAATVQESNVANNNAIVSVTANIMEIRLS